MKNSVENRLIYLTIICLVVGAGPWRGVRFLEGAVIVCVDVIGGHSHGLAAVDPRLEHGTRSLLPAGTVGQLQTR